MDDCGQTNASSLPCGKRVTPVTDFASSDDVDGSAKRRRDGEAEFEIGNGNDSGGGNLLTHVRAAAEVSSARVAAMMETVNSDGNSGSGTSNRAGDNAGSFMGANHMEAAVGLLNSSSDHIFFNSPPVSITNGQSEIDMQLSMVKPWHTGSPDGQVLAECAQVNAFLTKLELSRYLPRFLACGFKTMRGMFSISDADMQETIGMDLEHAQLLKRKLLEERENRVSQGAAGGTADVSGSAQALAPNTSGNILFFEGASSPACTPVGLNVDAAHAGMQQAVLQQTRSGSMAPLVGMGVGKGGGPMETCPTIRGPMLTPMGSMQMGRGPVVVPPPSMSCGRMAGAPMVGGHAGAATMVGNNFGSVLTGGISLGGAPLHSSHIASPMGVFPFGRGPMAGVGLANVGPLGSFSMGNGPSSGGHLGVGLMGGGPMGGSPGGLGPTDTGPMGSGLMRGGTSMGFGLLSCGPMGGGSMGGSTMGGGQMRCAQMGSGLVCDSSVGRGPMGVNPMHGSPLGGGSLGGLVGGSPLGSASIGSSLFCSGIAGHMSAGMCGSMSSSTGCPSIPMVPFTQQTMMIPPLCATIGTQPLLPPPAIEISIPPIDSSSGSSHPLLAATQQSMLVAGKDDAGAPSQDTPDNTLYMLAQLAEESAQMASSAVAFCASPAAAENATQITAVSDVARQAAERALWASNAASAWEPSDDGAQEAWVAAMKQICHQSHESAQQASQDCAIYAAKIAGAALAARSKQGDKSRVPCKFFFTQGHCIKADDCEFSHDALDQQARPLALKNERLCSFFKAGQCSRGRACPFAHGSDELAEISKVKATPNRLTPWTGKSDTSKSSR